MPIIMSIGDRRIGAETGRSTGRRPEAFEALARFARTAACHAIGNCDRVHGSSAGATDGGDVKPLVLEQPVEHAPGKRAMRPAALQRKLDRLLGAICFS